MMTNTNSEAKIEAALATMKAAQDYHASLLKWSYTTMRMTQVCCDLQLNAAYDAVTKSERAYARLCR